MTVQETGAKAAILLADDSKLVRFTAKKVLGEEFDLHLVEDGSEAWDVLSNSDNIQLVLSDLQMPVLDGFGLLEKIRQSDNDRISSLPVIMITGAENKDGPKEEAMTLGATDFITKPFDHAHLKARVRAHVGHQRQTRSLMEQVNVDTVSGLLNRQGFESRLAKDVAFAARHQHCLSVMLLQLDDYKPLFEKIGREGYDKVVGQISKSLQESVRKEDTVARAGLAQFLISLPTAQADGASELARRIATSIEGYNLKVDGQPWKLSLSIGVFSAQPGCALDANAVLDGVHQALDQTLNQGNSHISVVGMQSQSAELQLSVDQLILELGRTGKLPENISPKQVIEALKPLVAFLSEEQRKALVG